MFILGENHSSSMTLQEVFMVDVAEATTAVAEPPVAEAPDAETVADEQTTQAPVAEESTPTEPQAETVRFGGTSRNMVAGVSMLIASVMAFTMGMTDVFFAEATAWTLGIWGALLIYAGMLDIYRVFEITDNALVIKDNYRPWGRLKVWDWERLNRLDVVVKKPSAQAKDVEMQIFYNPEGELAMEREDRVFDAELARLVIERAGLRPAGRENPSDLTQLPVAQKQAFTWNK
jgi:hypothetical protein